MSNLKLNLVDVEYIRHHTDIIFNNQHGLIPSPPSEKKDDKKKESPKKKKASFKKKSGKKKGGGKKGKVDGEASGKLIQQKKNMFSNYMEACKKLKCVPSHHICNLFSLQESVDWTKEERELMNQPITEIAIEEKLGPAGARALACALVGYWVGGSNAPLGPPYEILKSLTIKKGQLGRTGADAIGGILQFGGKLTGSSSIEILNLYRCKLTPDGLKSIGLALRFGNNNSLLELRLDGDDSIGDEGVSFLCNSLTTNSKLKVLSLGSCDITENGAKAVGDLLKSPRCNLDYLSLESNNLGQRGLMHVCNGLLKLKVKIKLNQEIQYSERCSKLKTLNISSIGLVNETLSRSYEGVESLAHVLLENDKILNIDFNLNILDEYGGKVLYSALSTAKISKNCNCKLKNFNVSPELPSKLFNELYLNEKIPRKFDGIPLLSVLNNSSSSNKNSDDKDINQTIFNDDTVTMPTVIKNGISTNMMYNNNGNTAGRVVNNNDGNNIKSLPYL